MAYSGSNLEKVKTGKFSDTERLILNTAFSLINNIDTRCSSISNIMSDIDFLNGLVGDLSFIYAMDRSVIAVTILKASEGRIMSAYEQYSRREVYLDALIDAATSHL